MVKGTSRLEAITKQNELLKEQNDLLREQNELLRRRTSTDSAECFVEDINRDEMRDGFLVTSQRKKLWNVQLGLINEFARVCEKHNLRWFAAYGTLLGAVRHKGFIPWDDDVDIAMLRPEYEKFKRIAPSEFKSPYHLDIWHDYRREDDLTANSTDLSLPLVTKSHVQEKWPWGAPFFPLIKIRDERTFLLEFPKQKTFNQGIWIDIFPFDSVPLFEQEQQNLNFEIGRTLYYAATNPRIVADAMQKQQKLLIKYDDLQKFIRLPYRQRGLQLEDFLAKNFSMSGHVGAVMWWYLSPKHESYDFKNFADITWLPFEKIEVPVPVDYESVLSSYYGDWRTPVYTHTHASTYSTDIPWEEYLQKAKFN